MYHWARYIKSDGYTWYVQEYTMYIPCIYRTSTYMWYIPGIFQAYTENQGSSLPDVQERMIIKPLRQSDVSEKHEVEIPSVVQIGARFPQVAQPEDYKRIPSNQGLELFVL